MIAWKSYGSCFNFQLQRSIYLPCCFHCFLEGGWEWAGLEGLCVCVFIKVLQRNYMFLSFFSWVFLEEKFTELLSIHVHKSVFLTCGNSFFIIDLLSCNIETQRRILKFDSWKEREYKEKKKNLKFD